VLISKDKKRRKHNALLCRKGKEGRKEMSGKYLHGLIIDGDFVYVKDNIFSHMELRKIWTGKETKHKLIQEWSWDFVTRKFVETESQIIPIAEKWIEKNLNSHKDLVSWINRNWEGLVNGDERAREIYIWNCISPKAKHKNKLVKNFLKAYADRDKAYADWTKANGKWTKEVDADRSKSYADWILKADADWSKAYADWDKADADWNKAYQDWSKADKKWKTKILKPIFINLLKKYPNKYWKEK